MLNDPEVRNPRPAQQRIILVLIGIGLISVLNFCYHFFFETEYFGHPLLFGLLCAVLLYGLLRDLSLWYYYAAIRVPETPPLQRTFTVDVLTTYFPGEPYDMIVATLEAIQRMTYPHTTYLCDEADDPFLKQFCADHGIIHVTRQVRVDAKAGNINNALKQATGEVCLVLDPDHVPEPDFLDHVIPHFQDEAIGFVQTVQAYYNKFDTLVAKGSAQQTFHFYGPMMMTMNSYGTVNAIGANCTFRRAALDSIGGHAPGLAEDMHTAMRLYSKGWKSVYVPRILARGLVPSSLTAYFKQQIKWSRGVFDLIVKVYPRIFTQLTWRQRLHYALMPIHYLAGIFYLLGFLIPVLSLVLSDTPWTGNIFYFLLLIGPVLFTSFVLRFYIQKWLISDDERGFHIIGGLLEILTWWVFTLGFVYTLVDKKVPYLPTPKNDEESTHFSLLIPNLTVGVVSLAAVTYGLPRDLTPFSLVMAGFAVLNAVFMFFTLYLAYGATNRFGVLRTRLPRSARTLGRHARDQLLWGIDAMTLTIRKLAPLLLIAVLVGAFFMLRRYDRPEYYMRTNIPDATTGLRSAPKLGTFHPAGEGGLSDLDYISGLERDLDVSVEVVGAYIPWSGGSDLDSVEAYLHRIINLGAVPLVTWEPWVSHFPNLDSLEGPAEERLALRAIANGHFDAYVLDFAGRVRELEAPVYLRFAHEFDNPDYPWSAVGGNTPDDFVLAWRHVVRLFQQAGAENVSWVWNPWRPENAGAFYPGRDWVTYVGLTSLNYGPGADSIPELSFTELYAAFQPLIDSLPTAKVLLAEFGTLGSPAYRQRWHREARQDIVQNHPEIAAVVAFDNAFDRNVPVGRPERQYLDWTIDPALFFHPPQTRGSGNAVSSPQQVANWFELLSEPVRGVAYKKGGGRTTDRYIPSRRNLEQDYASMRRLGLNTVRVSQPGIYAHNLLSIAEEYDLRVVYDFWIPDTLDFIHDQEVLAQYRDEVLQAVSDYRDYPALLHWDLSNDVLSGLANYHLQPELHRQRLAYLEWSGELMREIRRIDPEHPVLTNLKVSPTASQLVEEYGLLDGPGDVIGLIVPDNSNVESVREILHRYRGQVLVTYIGAPRLLELAQDSLPDYCMLANWQNEWRQNLISFDGLLDFEGRPTRAYARLAQRWETGEGNRMLPGISVVLPALPPYVDRFYTYRGTVNYDDRWLMAKDLPASTNYRFEWRLIRMDRYGTPTVMTRLEDGPELRLQMPPDHLSYQLVFTLTDGEYSRSIRVPLLPK